MVVHLDTFDYKLPEGQTRTLAVPESILGCTVGGGTPCSGKGCPLAFGLSKSEPHLPRVRRDHGDGPFPRRFVAGVCTPGQLPQ